MHRSLSTLLCVAGFALAAAAPAAAAVVTPTFTTFDTLAGATFNGTGIPNDAVAITTYSDASLLNPLVLGLTATQRFQNPTLSNDGAGSFLAQAGGDTLNGQPGYAMWNFNFYVSGDTRNLNFKLFYDSDPAVGNDQSSLGWFVPVLNLNNSNNLVQDSVNLGFTFLTGPAIPGFVAPPAYGAFSPTATGEYSFALVAYSGTTEVARSAILVTAVPEPGTLALMVLGLLGTVLLVRRHRG